jgi:hypothetical protein
VALAVETHLGHLVDKETSGEAEATLPTQICKLQSVTILCINVRSLNGILIEPVHLIKVYDAHLVFLQETWLDASHEAVEIPDFIYIGRRDRSENENRGGIATYIRADIRNVVLLKHCDDAENFGFSCIGILLRLHYVIGIYPLLLVMTPSIPSKLKFPRCNPNMILYSLSAI